MCANYQCVTRRHPDRTASACCCSIEVCAIMMNIVLQDAPFLAFRLLIICHYKIINYMNIFFTCKNSLVSAPRGSESLENRSGWQWTFRVQGSSTPTERNSQPYQVLTTFLVQVQILDLM
ncbi:Transmembrane protein 26 [Eumeta japonica]|uniref:Transmembrane protein 26 n=1 Tax=Eumeta variegata TaxID=151549 RepID=A0A4C1TJK7_EUMVA|nr:Transmembrane protein 26 [Eumeta japonica]